MEYYSLKEYGKLRNKKHIRQKAEDIAEAMGKDPDAVEKQLINRMESKVDWRKINQLVKDSRNGGLNKLIVPDQRREGKRKECCLQKEIEKALLKENKRKCLQTCDAPPLCTPLLEDIGLRGDGPEADGMLKGDYEPPEELNECSKACPRALESPKKDELDNLPRPKITEKDDIEDPRKTEETTSLSPSGLH